MIVFFIFIYFFLFSFFSCTQNSPSDENFDENTDDGFSPENTDIEFLEDEYIDEEASNPETWILRIPENYSLGYGIRFIEMPDGDIVLSGIMKMSQFGDSDGWIVKLSGQGNVIWQKIIGCSGKDYISDITLTYDGGFVFVGSIQTSDTNFDGWVVKIDGSGNILWQKMLTGTNYENFHSVHETLEQNLLVGGISGDNFILTMLDKNGNILWQKIYTGERRCEYYKMAPCENGDILVAGSASNEGFDLSRLNKSGNVIWHKSVLMSLTNSVSHLFSIMENPGGEIILGYQNFIAKFDGNGNILWQKTSPSEAKFSKVIEINDGQLIFTGSNATPGKMWFGGIDEEGKILWQKTIDELGCLEAGFDILRSIDGSILVLSGGCDFSHIVKIGRTGDFYGSCDILLDENFSLETSNLTVTNGDLLSDISSIPFVDSNCSISDSTNSITLECPIN